MSFTKSAASVAALTLLLGATAATAQTTESPTVIGCLHMAKKVSAALDANPQSPNFSTAKAQAQGAQGFCSQGLYKIGVDGYAKALDLLGAS
ncbi:MAG TPA: hypothetical protein VNU97_17280 [Rhizomicrobium sp.]|jgi:hypothetical protein|nr:hypothetical protein [Rhizomicrobium sp.]